MNNETIICPACGSSIPDKDHEVYNDLKLLHSKIHCKVKGITCTIGRHTTINSDMDYYCLLCGKKTLVTNASNTLYYCVDCMRYFSMRVERDSE